VEAELWFGESKRKESNAVNKSTNQKYKRYKKKKKTPMRAELLRVTATQKDQIFKTQLNLEKRRDGRSKKGKKEIYHNNIQIKSIGSSKNGTLLSSYLEKIEA
jgi:hypothetical protein